MKKWLRWQGLVAFLVVVGLLAGAWFFLVDLLVERTIESAGTRAVGARVDLDKADLGLMPLGLTLHGLAVTDVDQPMRNAVEITRAEFLMDLGGLLRRKVIVEKMAIDGVRFGTERKTSGALPERAKTPKKVGTEPAGPSAWDKILEKSGCGDVTMPSFEIPDIAKLLEGEVLETVTLANKVQRDIQGHKSKWQKELSSLPDEKTLEEYRRRIEKLSGKKKGIGDLLGTANDAATIQKDLDRDLKQLKTAKKRLESDLSTLKKDLAQLKSVTGQDIRRLKKKYTLSSKGLANMSMLILGERLCGGIEKALAWGQRLKPYLGKIPRGKGAKDEPVRVEPLRGRGLDIRFREEKPLPDLFIRLARAQVVLAAGELTARIENISSDQTLTGLPTTFNFLGRDMPAAKSINGQGHLDFTQPPVSRYQINFGAKGYRVTALPLSSAGGLPMAINKALADADLAVSLAGEKIDATLDMRLSAIDFAATPPKDAGHLVGTIADTLAKVKRLQAKAKVRGTVEALDVRLTSDLDKKLKAAVGDLIRKEGAKLEAMIRKEVAAQVKGPLKDAQGAYAGMGGISGELTKRLKLGDELVKDLKNQAKLPF